MSLEKQTTLSRIEILSNEFVVAHYVASIYDNGLLLAEQSNPKYIRPGDDYSSEDAKVQAICAAVHTAGVVAAYQAATAAQGV